MNFPKLDLLSFSIGALVGVVSAVVASRRMKKEVKNIL